MGRILKPLVRGGGWYPSKKWIPLVKNGGYTTQNGGETEPVWATASGAIASFTTPFAYPLKKLLAQINPVQDLHGQDAPYPPGGGVNLLQNIATTTESAGITYTVASDGTVTANGTATGASALLINSTTVLPNGSYTLSGCPSGGSGATYYLRAERGLLATDVGSGATGTVSSTDALFVAIRITSGTTVSNLVFKPMICLSSTTNPTTFRPYSNICPITGHTGLSVEVTGFNVWDEEAELGSINTLTGENIELTGQIRVKNYVPVVGGETYRMVTTTSPDGVWMMFFDRNKGVITEGLPSFSSANNARKVGNGFYVQMPSNCAYVRFYFQIAYGTTYNHDTAINYPSTDTSYHAYTGEAISVSWQDTAGTVYGGTATYNGDGTWTLVAEYALASAKKNQFNAKSTGSVMDYRNAGPFPPTASITDWDKARQQQISNMARIANANSEGQYGNYVAVVYTLASGLGRSDVRVSEDLYQTMTDDDSIEVCYKLLEPQTYTITTGELISTLVGQNNVFVDTGNVEVTYRTE